MSTLHEIIYENVREGELYEKLDRNWVRCFACGHCCKIPDGQPGVCKVRYNRGGTLFVPWGYVGGVQCDPIEKKPFFHAHPGALAYSFGMLGCDLHCGYCQNWVTSQALRDPAAVGGLMRVAPAELVLDAMLQRSPHRPQRCRSHSTWAGRSTIRSPGRRRSARGDARSVRTARCTR